MKRLYRLALPAVICAVIGFLLGASSIGLWGFGGSLATLCGLALLFQVYLSVMAVFCIDDLAPGSGLFRVRAGRKSGMLGIAMRPVRFGTALKEFYGTLFFPAFLLAFGLGVPLCGLTIALMPDEHVTLIPNAYTFDHELALGFAWSCMTIFLMVHAWNGPMILGYVYGALTAIVFSELLMAPSVVSITLVSWGCVGGLGLLFLVLVRGARRRPIW